MEQTLNGYQPSCEEAARYLKRWDETERFVLQERALGKLFHTLAPFNTDLSDVLLKASVLNDFYGTNIYAVFPVAKHILELKIDERLRTGDVTLVNEIALVEAGGKTKRFYSFAAKYCSHHEPEHYPIYDSYVDRVLRYFRERDRFCRFRNKDLRDYLRFKEILELFRAYYGLERYSLKELDQYLWQLGKDVFPAAY